MIENFHLILQDRCALKMYASLENTSKKFYFQRDFLFIIVFCIICVCTNPKLKTGFVGILIFLVPISFMFFY